MPVVIVGLRQAADKTHSAANQSAAPTGVHGALPAKKPVTLGGIAMFVLLVIVIGLFSPVFKFFVGVGVGLFGLFFLAIGMQTAWKLTRQTAVVIDGPFEANVTA